MPLHLLIPPLPSRAPSSTKVRARPEPTTTELHTLPRFPLGNLSRQLGITFIADKRPAFFIYSVAALVVVRDIGTVFDQGFGVFEIAVDGLNGCCYAVFLFDKVSIKGI